MFLTNIVKYPIENYIAPPPSKKILFLESFLLRYNKSGYRVEYMYKSLDQGYKDNYSICGAYLSLAYTGFRLIMHRLSKYIIPLLIDFLI